MANLTYIVPAISSDTAGASGAIHRYIAFEEWAVAQNGGTLSPDAVQKHNGAITVAVTLNSVEDLDEVHSQING